MVHLRGNREQNLRGRGSSAFSQDEWLGLGLVWGLGLGVALS